MFFKEIFQIFKHEFHQVVLGLYFLTSGKLTLLKMSLKRSKDLNFYLAQVTLEFQPFNNVFLFNHTFLLSQESFVSSQKNIKMNWETDMSIIPEELYSSLSVNCIFNVFLKNLDLEDELDDFIFLPWDLIFKRVRNLSLLLPEQTFISAKSTVHVNCMLCKYVEMSRLETVWFERETGEIT